MITRCSLLVLVFGILARTVHSDAAANQEMSGTNSPVSFYRQVRPILQGKCPGCTQPAKAKADSVLTEYEKLFAAGESGKKPVFPGKPNESFLLAQIVSTNGAAEMPKGKPPL